VLQQILNRAAQVFLDLGDLERHHQLSGLIGRGRAATMIEVRRERHETLGGEAIGHPLDMRNQSPPLLDHDHTRPRSGCGNSQITRSCSAIAFKFDHFT
jgi:hypothetical protein